jgi:hypothetical protein
MNNVVWRNILYKRTKGELNDTNNIKEIKENNGRYLPWKVAEKT